MVGIRFVSTVAVERVLAMAKVKVVKQSQYVEARNKLIPFAARYANSFFRNSSEPHALTDEEKGRWNAIFHAKMNELASPLLRGVR